MKKTIHNRLFAFCVSTLYVLSAGHQVLADDTEVLIGPGGQAWAKPNVLFVMDTSTSMDTKDNNLLPDGTTDGRTRLEIVQDVFDDLMTANSGFNVALMRFDSGGDGGYFVSPMQELNASTRSSIIAASDNFTANGNTPLSETFYEAARFWTGMSVDYGDDSSPGTNHNDVFNGSDYISPINAECQKNYTILLTDGNPTSDTGADSNVSSDFLGGASCDGSGNGKCLDDIAGYLHNTDLSSGASGITGDQTVETFTIGFTTNQTLLEDTANEGGGQYITANNASDLSAAFASILQTITNTNNTFSPPALSANSFSGVSHFNKLYFALFEPAATPKWNGNVKPYALNDSFEIIDADDIVAVNAGGFFKDTSRSFWANVDDGANIADGGANGRLPAATSRNLYTYTDDYDAAGLVPDTPALTNSINQLTDGNTDLTAELLGLPVLTSPTTAQLTAQAAQRSNIISTIRSSNLGAPLHSQPALVTYGGADAANADLTLFVATNDGFLHALNASPSAEGTADGGKELFAFIPKELLGNLDTLASGTGSHPYGLDGSISVWRQESDDTDETIETTDGDHVYVYVGMRRGGNNYYALDVTNRNAPTLKWVIRGGPGGTTGFEELGQSWSKPTLTSIPYGSSGYRKVLVFGGGYDTDQDANPLNADDDIGRAIFIVDADTGERLWWAGPAGSGADLELSTLTNSIPSDVSLFDSDRDGHTDRLYVGDMRGQVFRFDLTATTTAVSGTGVRLAKLSGTTEANNRRFYYPPDLVLTRGTGNSPYLSLNIGSGYRAHPLNPLTAGGTPAPRVNDRFYALRDYNVYQPVPASFTTISDGSDGTTSNLFDATSSLVTSASDISDLASSNGWYITLGAGNGEKVLASSLTMNGTLYFTTYTPPTSVPAGNCAPPPGTGRLYEVSLSNATPVVDNNADGDTDDIEDRASDIHRPGIPPGTTVVFRENSSGRTEIGRCEGTECDNLPNPNQIKKSYWRDGTQ